MICGGAMLGYDSTPRLKIDSTPPSVIRIAMTHAKMGRSMKKFDIAPTRHAPLEGGADIGDLEPPLEAADPGGCHGTPLAGAPGRTACTPETITSSPAASPEVTIQSRPCMPLVVTSRRATLPSLPTINT